jgi:hypothetical protein
MARDEDVKEKIPLPEWVELDGDDDSMEDSLFEDGEVFLVAILVHNSRLKRSYWDIHKITAKVYDEEGVHFYHLPDEAFDGTDQVPWEYSWGDVEYFMRLGVS